MRLRAAKVRNDAATTAQSIVMGDISNLLTLFALSWLWSPPSFIYCTRCECEWTLRGEKKKDQGQWPVGGPLRTENFFFFLPSIIMIVSPPNAAAGSIL
jgi:hypothetical protein